MLDCRNLDLVAPPPVVSDRIVTDKIERNATAPKTLAELLILARKRHGEIAIGWQP
jgi:hypothetical protein